MNSISLRIRINDRHTLQIEGDPETFGDLLAYAGQNLDAIKNAYTKLEGEIRAPQGAPVVRWAPPVGWGDSGIEWKR